MKRALTVLIALLLIFSGCINKGNQKDSPDNMDWWRDARFGMFIHWGLYSVPAGEWKGSTGHAEWIRTTAAIPLEEYDQLAGSFNPVDFDAGEWVSAARNAGMKYIVITSKHHDGFCLFDSDYTDFDIMETPFKRDILKELSDECHRQGIKICWYHSIMDWHHYDYLPRRGWETDRESDTAEFSRYIEYMKSQLAELLSGYGEIGVLWFDGEWEDTWTHEMGVDLYDYVKSLQEEILVNNRVDKGRQGMAGMTAEGEFRGDFGTPEQEIPDRGLEGVDWETCMTMNDHWGYNRLDNNWKSDEELVRKLADIASKGGNFLLNVGPTADGNFPEESIRLLDAIGDWMEVNSESIYGTSASPFEGLTWGRCTKKEMKGFTRLYLHVFDFPVDGKIVLPGLQNRVKDIFVLGSDIKVGHSRIDDKLLIHLPDHLHETMVPVIAVDIKGVPEVVN